MWSRRLPFFFFNDTATTEIYTLSLHDALPIYAGRRRPGEEDPGHGREGAPDHRLPRDGPRDRRALPRARRDRKSTRLNSSHANISYAVFCLKKKNAYITYCTLLSPKTRPYAHT